MIITRGYSEPQQIITRGLGIYEEAIQPSIPIPLPYIPMRIPLPTAFVPFLGEVMPIPAEVELEPEQVEAWLAMLRDGDEFLVLLD